MEGKRDKHMPLVLNWNEMEPGAAVGDEPMTNELLLTWRDLTVKLSDDGLY